MHTGNDLQSLLLPHVTCTREHPNRHGLLPLLDREMDLGNQPASRATETVVSGSTSMPPGGSF